MEKRCWVTQGFLTSLKKSALSGMIDVVKGVEPKPATELFFRCPKRKRRCGSTASAKRKQFVHTAAWLQLRRLDQDRHILKVAPEHGPPMGFHLREGKVGWGHINSEDRLTTALIREGDRFRQASWTKHSVSWLEDSQRSKRTRDRTPSRSFSSSKCTNEESYLMQKLARAGVGTNNVDNCSRYCQSPATQGLFRTVATGGDSGSISDIDQG